MSSQLKGLAADVGRTPADENPDQSTEPAADTGREEDWGIAPPKSGMSRETKIGFAFVFMLLVVFGFVVYKKVEQNRLQKGDLLAGVEESSKSQPTPVEPAPEPTDPQNPIEEDSLPPDQGGDPFPEPTPVEPPPQEFSPDSWDRPTYDPRENQHQIASSPPPNGEDSTSIDQFPQDAGNSFAQQEPTPAEPFPADQFPEEPQQSEPTTVTVLPTDDPSEFEPVPDSETQDQFAKAPEGQDFEPPEQFSLDPEPEPEPVEPDAAVAKSGGENTEFSPFPADLPDQSESASAPPEIDNEQFSAQSEPAPAPEGNPFGEIPESETVQSAPSEGDPFAHSSDETNSKASTPPAFEADPAPTELAQPNPLPVADDTATEITQVEGPGFERPEEPTPQESPADSFAQLPTPADDVGFSEAPTLVPAGDEACVYKVRPGDNYWKISKAQYGTVRYFSALARYNEKRIPDPKRMRPGMKVLTPARKVLEAQYPDLFPRFANAGSVANVGHEAGGKAGFFVDAKGRPMYRVGKNDTLGGIAQKHLGRFSRWVEIYRMNQHRLKDPNALTVGDVLELPANASRVNMVQHASGVR